MWLEFYEDSQTLVYFFNIPLNLELTLNFLMCFEHGLEKPEVLLRKSAFLPV
jgi:hypothetical protein